MFRIGYRTIKTALGVMIAIWIAQLCNLEHYTSAGIITILCIQVTKKKSLMTSWARLFACIVAILFSIVFFEIIGYQPIAVGLLILFFIPTAVFLKVQDGIVTSSVIILHLYNEGSYSHSVIINEFGIIIIGIGVALIMNLYMPSVDEHLKKFQEEIEIKFSIIFKEIANYLRENDTKWDGNEITEVHIVLQKAKSLAFRDVQNHFLRHENTYYSYFKIREQQLEIIERILPIVSSLSYSSKQGELLADFIENISNSIHPGNTAKRFLIQINELKNEFRAMQLPKTSDEFEERASLFQLLKEMEQYLIIKSYFRPNT